MYSSLRGGRFGEDSEIERDCRVGGGEFFGEVSAIESGCVAEEEELDWETVERGFLERGSTETDWDDDDEEEAAEARLDEGSGEIR